jgi:hypothetical protein
MSRHLALALATFALISAAPGQNKKLSVRFLAERAPEELGQVVMVAGKVQSEAFALDNKHLTDPIAAPGRIIALLRAADTQPLNVSKTLVNIVLPEAGDSFIVLLIPDPKGGFKSVVINSSDINFQGGDIYFYNHANKMILGYVGTSKFMLKPGEGRLLRPTGVKEETYYDVGFGVREADGDRPLRSLRWPVLTASRSYVFFYQNPVKDRVDYRSVEEFVSLLNNQATP